MVKRIKIKIFADPGHAWARFPRTRLKKLGIADQISAHSYQNGANVFLEEDDDLHKLVIALKSVGYLIQFDTSQTDRSSKIRGYHPYIAD